MRGDDWGRGEAETSWLSGVNLLAGLWLIVSAFLFGGFGEASGGAWNSLIVGIVIAALAASRAYRPDAGSGLSWINAILGAWMIAAPFVYDYTFNAARTWNSIIVGFIIVIFAVASATTSGASTTWSRARGTGGGWGYGTGYDRPYRSFGTSSQPYGEAEPYGAGYAGRGYGNWEGEYRGVGPRGYQRSDEQLTNAVCERMSDDPRLDAREIEVQVREGEVTLLGTVPSRSAKRLAEELADSVGSVRDVHNQLRVRTEGLRDVRRVA
jgi:hypothetical protein